jgi:2,4-dienoyl-CoA reductase (NADPH2)
MTIPIEESLRRWHRIVSERDLADLSELAHPDCVFRSPVAHTPYPGRDALVLVLSTVLEVFTDFTYHREFVEGDSVALEFSAGAGGKLVKGIDLIRFDDDGRIVEFEVFIRPLSGLIALAEEMKQRLEGADLG